jgi:YVTN family beta-propeller protein
MTPRQVGNYRLDHLLGVGGMGEVYKAYDTHRDRYVALKLLPEAFSGDREYLRRFQRESHVAARLREPHVIPIHDFGEIDGRLFIDMRLVDGVDIRMLLDKNGPIAPQRAVNLLSQVAQALDAAYADDLVHRDIKPSNILVTSSDFVYVVDFGIARSIGGRQTSLTITGATIGTLDYMAPERFAGHSVDGRADIYSLACLLHECLTATPPFEGKDLPSLMYAHLYSSPPQASSIVEGVPPALDAVVARGMAKEPADRFSTAGALAAAAQEALLTEVPSPASRPRTTIVDRQDAVKSPGHEPEPAGDRFTLSVPFIPPESLKVTSADGPGGALPPENMPQSASSDPKASRPPRSAATGRPTREPAWRRRGMLLLTGAVAIGVVIALVTNFARQKTDGPTKTNDAAATSGVPSRTSAPASVAVPTVAAKIPVGKTPSYIQVAPNGKFAYITNQNAGAITVLDTTTDRVSGIINIPQGPPQFISFSPDSRYAYVSIYNNSDSVHLIAFIDTATSTVTSTVQVDNDKPGPSTTSPDGRYLYVPNHDMTMGVPNGNIIDVIDTASKRLTGRIAVPMNPHWLVFGDGGRYFYTSDHMSGVVTVLNAHNNSIVKEIQVGQTPHGEAASPDGSRLAVTSWSGNEVSLIDTATDKIVARIPVGRNPQADAYAPDGRHLYTVNNRDNTVTVIDTSDNRVTAEIPTGNSPTSISVLPNGRQAYVTNENDGTIDVLDIAK